MWTVGVGAAIVILAGGFAHAAASKGASGSAKSGAMRSTGGRRGGAMRRW